MTALLGRLRFARRAPRNAPRRAFQGAFWGAWLLARAALLLLALSAVACGPAGTGGRPAAADSVAAAGAGTPYHYEVYLRGMLSDTLRGPARFGRIFDPVTRRQQWVLSLRSGGDVTSGLYLARPDTSLPEPGTYPIVARRPIGAADSARAAGAGPFTMIYRAGMRRAFHSQSGTLELTTVSDTLIEGTFQVTLDGTAALPGQPPREGTVTARGDFRARKATVGFIFGV